MVSICVLTAVSAHAQLDIVSSAWKKHSIVDRTLGAVHSAVANDWDKDGQVDVISSHGGAVTLYRGGGWKPVTLLEFAEIDEVDRKIRPACIHSCLLDVDGDGDLDFIGSNNCLFLLLCPDKPLEQKWEFSVIDDEIWGSHCVITGDIDGDGKEELIANSGRDKGTEFPNSICYFEVPNGRAVQAKWPRTVFADQDAPGGSHYMGYADLNGDGRVDITCAAKGGEKHPGGEWFAWWEQGEDRKKPWTKHVLADKEVGATHIEPHDVNLDGVIDIIATRGHGMGLLWFEGPDYQAHEIDPTMASPHTLDVGDYDSDGDLDVFVCGRELDGEVVCYQNDGKGVFKKHLLESDQSAYDLRLVDMDGDGDLDVLLAGQFSQNILWFENLGK